MSLGRQSLAQLADWYGAVIEFDNPDEIDWENPAAVVREAFTASDCGNFAEELFLMTGWPVVMLGQQLVHALVRSPEGRLLDASGWVTPADLARRYGCRKLSPCKPGGNPMSTDLFDINDAGINEERARVVSAIRALPWAPFDTMEFQRLSARPVIGVDIPATI